MSQSHPSNLWPQRAGSGVVPQPTEMVLQTVDGEWRHVASPAEQGAALDPGDGSRTIFNLTSEYFAVSDGAGGFVLSDTGPAAGVLTDDGAGGLTLLPIGPGVAQAGRFLPDSRGDVHPIRFSAAELLFVSVRNAIISS